ncbi:MAG: hypothetical protein QOF89_328 [Acidobacteriota bacterium]|jgi:molybdopterin converting factor small subunit|nr:hypothetical protein [Acidobacteriota bacterium]
MSAKIKVEVSSFLGGLTSPDRVVFMEADTPDEAMVRLAARFPRLREVLLNEAGHVRGGGVALFINSRQLSMIQGGMHAKLCDGDELAVVTPISGG